MRKQYFITLVKYLLGFGLLAWVIWMHWKPGGDTPGIADALQRPFRAWPFTLAVLITFVSMYLTIVRWYILVVAQELPFTMSKAVSLGCLGFFFSNFLPGSVGGDIAKAIAIAREQSRRTVAVATVMVDRIVGLWGLVWLVAIVGSGFWLCGDEALRTKPSLQVVLILSIAIVAISLAVWFTMGMLSKESSQRFAEWLSRFPKIGNVFAELWRAVWMYRSKRKSVALAVMLAAFGHIGFVLSFYFCAQTFLPAANLAQIPSVSEHFLIVPIGMTIQALVPVPGGVGAGEYGYGQLYALVGKSKADGVFASLVARIVMWGLSLIGYFVYLRMKPSLDLQPSDEPVAPANWESQPLSRFGRVSAWFGRLAMRRSR